VTVSTGEQLILEVADLAVRAHAGEPVAAELTEAAQTLRRVYDNPPGLPYRAPWPRRRYPTTDPLIALRDRVEWDGDGYLAVPAGEVRRADPGGQMPLTDRLGCHNLATLPGALPTDDAALVVVYEVRSPVAPLLLAVSRGQSTGPAVDHLVGRVVHGRRHPWEY
jgi:hypothetical protein